MGRGDETAAGEAGLTLNRQLDDIAPKPGITDAQRAVLAEHGIEREIDLLTKQVSGVESLLPRQRSEITSARLDALKTRRDALRAQRDELRETNLALAKATGGSFVDCRQKTALENSIAEKGETTCRRSPTAQPDVR